MSSLTALQLECYSEHCRAAAEGVVVGVGVDAVAASTNVSINTRIFFILFVFLHKLPLIDHKLFINQFVLDRVSF